MKIRWTPKSVRFRITPSELAALERGQSCCETLALAGGGWRAIIERGENQTSIEFEEGKLRVFLSDFDARQLSEPNREGVYFETDELRYFIEKDFPCIHPRAADAMEAPTETFAPPAGFEERKME